MMQRKWTAARHDAAFFAYRVAMPRHRFISAKAFSTRRRRRWMYSSYSSCSLLFAFGGITGAMPASFAIPTMASTS